MSESAVHPIFHQMKYGTPSAEELIEWIEREPDLLYAKDWGSGTVLHYAADQGNTALLRYLLTKGLDLNTRKNIAALYQAANVEIAQLLLDAGASLAHGYPYGILFSAGRSNRPEVFRFLIEEAKKIGRDLVTGNDNILFLVARFPDDDEKEKMGCLPILIEYGANLNAIQEGNEFTVVDEAAMGNSVARFELLMSIGARFNRSKVYRYARKDVKAHIREKYPELTLTEWELNHEELSKITPEAYLPGYFIRPNAFLSIESELRIVLWTEQGDGNFKAFRGIQLHDRAIRMFALSPDKKRCTIPDWDGKLHLKDTSSLATVASYQFPTSKLMEYAAFSLCGKYIVALPCQDTKIYVLNLKTGKITGSDIPFTSQPVRLSFPGEAPFFSYISIEEGGAESGIFRIEPDESVSLIEAYTERENYSCSFNMHPSLPLFLLNNGIYSYDVDAYQKKQAIHYKWLACPPLTATLKWTIAGIPVSRSSCYFVEQYLLVLAPKKATYYLLENGKQLAEFEFILEEEDKLLDYVYETNQFLVGTALQQKLINNPIAL